jgi:hypothetical protein
MRWSSIAIVARKLVFLRDIEKPSSGPKIGFPLPDAGQLMTLEARA